LIKVNLLPKTLRKKVEPGWWRLIAGIVPVVAIAIMGAMQISATNTANALAEQKTQLEGEVQALQRYVDGQKALNEQQKALEGIVSIKTALEQGQTKWSEELTRFARRLPRASTGRPGSAVALKSLSLRHVDAGQAQTLAASKQYDGKVVGSEFTMNGEAGSLTDVTRFIRDFETDPNFGIQAGAVTNNKTNNTYSFSATIGLVPTNPVPAAVVAPATGTTPGTPAGTPPAGTAPAPGTPAPTGGQ
jgi:type IV pilus assembly protein PilN